jgi:hypothetical protein
MKHYVTMCLKAWWKGLGVLGAYIVYSIVAEGIGFGLMALPDNLKLPLGLAIYLVVVPPLLYLCHRWLWPEAQKNNVHRPGVVEERT